MFLKTQFTKIHEKTYSKKHNREESWSLHWRKPIGYFGKNGEHYETSFLLHSFMNIFESTKG